MRGPNLVALRFWAHTFFREKPFSPLPPMEEAPNHVSINNTPFNGPFSGTIQVSWYQKGKTNLDFTEARDSEWQWHQLGRMQVCT